MIRHFLERDFRTHQLHWALLLLITLVGVPFAAGSQFGTLLLAYAYFFFAAAPMNQFTGYTWRSQHVMSRNYLLSLPISRDRLFVILQVRAGVFWVPFVALMVLLPPFGRLDIVPGYYPAYALAVVLFTITLVNAAILLQLGMERIASLVTPSQRGLGHFVAVTSFSLHAALTGASIALYWERYRRMFFGVPPALGLVVVGLLAALSFRMARRQWQGQG